MSKQLNIAVLYCLNFDGSKMLKGGLERWCRDIALLVQQKGYKVTIYQKANTFFEKELAKDVRVVGIQCSLTVRGNWYLSRWLEHNTNREEPFIFATQEMALSKKIKRAVAINHGIWWDGDFPWYKRWIIKRLHYKFITQVKGTICVDTNYINWCHTELPKRKFWQESLFYVPNYVDCDKFRCHAGLEERNGYPTILFPRRLNYRDLDSDPRGSGFLIKALELLEADGIKTRVIFCGRGSLQNAVKNWSFQQGISDRVTVIEAPLDDMPQIYSQADVVVIPSIAHEGTSLSAIEAIASGKPTIVTHIGGLGNIVIDGLNGYVCNLSPASLAQSIRKALEDRALVNPAICDAFRNSLSKTRWERQVWSHLVDCLGLK